MTMFLQYRDNWVFAAWQEAKVVGLLQIINLQGKPQTLPPQPLERR